MAHKGDVKASGAMRKVVLELDELGDADVSYISLVKRGANKAPFKIIKRDEDTSMLGSLSLRTLFAPTRKQSTTPQIAAVIVNDGPASESLISQIQEMIGEPIDVTKDGTVTLLKYQEFDAEDALIIKQSESVATVISNAKKQFMAYPESTSFMENMNASGFIPGLYTAMDVMMETVRNILSESTTKGDAESMLTDAIGEFQTHVVQLMMSVPEMAFKMEGLFPEAADKASKTDTGTTTPAEAKRDGEETPKGQETQVGKSDPDKADGDGADKTEAFKADGTETATEQPAAKADDTTEEEAGLNEQLSALSTQLIEAVNGNMASLREEILEGLQKTDKAVEELRERLNSTTEELEGRLETAKAEMSAAVNGTVHGGALEDDTSGARGRGTAKADGDSDLWDTALRFPGFEIAIEDRQQ